jgi:hypothetical protein
MQAVLLDNVTHRDLRIVTTHGAAYGDDLMSIPVFPSEFRAAQAYYPIVFHSSGDGAVQPVALLGLREAENLFLGPRGWDVPYVPLAIERQPFLIGRSSEALMVHVDMSHPRVSADAGQPVFLPHGGTTEYLERINSVLLALHEGVQAVPAFVDALLRHELLESFVLDIELADGSQNRLAGFHTINEERLAALDAEALGALHRDGHLVSIYMVLASISHFRDLIERLNARIAAQT